MLSSLQDLKALPQHPQQDIKSEYKKVFCFFFFFKKKRNQRFDYKCLKKVLALQSIALQETCHIMMPMTENASDMSLLGATQNV